MNVTPEAARQIAAGVHLLEWSCLAPFDRPGHTFVAPTFADFECRAATRSKKYGRLLCWLTFGVGAEYFIRGVCIAAGKNVTKNPSKSRLTPPPSGVDLVSWSESVRKKLAPCLPEVEYQTLGALAGHARTIITSADEQDIGFAGIELLASAIRNRDAHVYVEGVRGSQFHVIPEVFVPALNLLVRELSPAEMAVALVALAV